MNAQTYGTLLPALLLLTPLALAVIDFFRIGRITREATPQPTQSWPAVKPQI